MVHAPASFKNWSSTRSLAECLALAEAGVRSAPRDPHFKGTGQAVQGLIRAGRQRIEVLEGGREYSCVASANCNAASWMNRLWQARRTSGLRRRALNRKAASTPGQRKGVPPPAAWIPDRPDPVCDHRGNHSASASEGPTE